MRLRVTIAVLLVAVAAIPEARTQSTPGAQTPSLIPFIGSFKITATWGAPSGGYHAQPAIDVKMKSGTPLYAAGAGTVQTISRDTTHCNPRDHGSTTAIGVRWCLDHGYANSGTRIVLRHPDGRLSQYLHLSSVVSTLAVRAQVKAGQLIGHSGNTGISEAPHLHYEERSSGKPVDPDTWLGCADGNRVTYDRLQNRFNQVVANGGYGCLGIDAAPPDKGPPSPSRAWIYGHSFPTSELFRVGPSRGGKDIPLGRIRLASGGSVTITDIALGRDVDGRQKLFAVSFSSFYSVNPSNGVARLISSTINNSSGSVNALVSLSKGVLLGASTNGTVLRIDTSTGRGVVIGSYLGFGSSGDLVVLSGNRIYATVTGGSSDAFVRVNPATGRATRVGLTGFAGVYGLATVRGRLLGLVNYTTDCRGGALLEINPSTGRGKHVRCLSFRAGGGT